MGGSAKRAPGGGVAAGSSGSSSDRLSTLPDCLFHAIMSFMKARQVVQTSVLSKRWRHLWRSVPCLDLDAHDGQFRTEANDSKKFANFVDNLLLFHDAPTLDAFRLHFGDFGDQSRDADRWIRRAIKYAPSVLEVLHFGDCRDARFPGLDTCSRRLKRLHLSSLLLHASFAQQVPVDETSEKFPAFSNLRTLHLIWCDLSDNFKRLWQFLHSAPNLEKLTLQDCKLAEGMSRKKVKSMRKTLRCQNLLTIECSNLKLIEIKSSEGNTQQLFNLLFSIWENLHETTAVLTKK